MTPFGTIGSLSAFWPLVEPVLDLLGARSVCEIGVERGAFSQQLGAWCRTRGGRYVGIDPAPRGGAATSRDVIVGRSLEVLPGLNCCDAYFIDGDHNYYTVRRELDLIERAARRRDADAPAIFLHDVGWPWGRRDMYHSAGDIPEGDRHPYSETLGVAFDRDELIEGGLRAPGTYAIAQHSGGARNGVLTAVEDFLAGDAAAGWTMLLMPVAFGLALLYDLERMPAACRQHLEALGAANSALAPLLRTLEANYVQLYLFGEDMKQYADGLRRHVAEQREHIATQDAHIARQDAHAAAQQAHIDEHERAYQDLLAHADALQTEYEKLAAAFQERARA